MERFRNILKRVDPVGWIVPALVVLVWLWLSASGQIPAYKLPSPVELVRVLADFASGGLGVTPYSGALWENLGISLLRVLSGFFIAGSLGMIMGFLTGRIPVLKRLFDPVIHLIKAVPGIGWLPIAIVWFGVGEGNTLFLMSLAAFFLFMSILLLGRRLFLRCIFRLGRCWVRKASGFSVPLFFRRLFLRRQWGFGLDLALPGLTWCWVRSPGSQRDWARS